MKKIKKNNSTFYHYYSYAWKILHRIFWNNSLLERKSTLFMILFPLNLRWLISWRFCVYSVNLPPSPHFPLETTYQYNSTFLWKWRKNSNKFFRHVVLIQVKDLQYIQSQKFHQIELITYISPTMFLKGMFVIFFQ